MLTVASYMLQVTNYLQEIAPNLCDRVELYSKATPLFDEYKIEDEINNILTKRSEIAFIVYILLIMYTYS